jgi:hypothetical protein
MNGDLRDTIDDPPMFLDREGQPISLRSWSDKYKDWSYRCVAEDQIEGFRVLTLWMGTVGSQLGVSKPLIFGTAVLREGKMQYREEERATEAEARDAHQMMLERVKTDVLLDLERRGAGENLTGKELPS